MTWNPHERSTRSRSLTFALVASLLGSSILAGCSSDPSTAARDAPASSTGSETTVAVPADPPPESSAADDSTTATAVAPVDPSTSAAPAEICPPGEYSAFGAFALASGTSEWSTCSPDEAYRFVIGASDDVVLVLQSGDAGSAHTIALDADSGVELWRQSTVRGLGVAPGPAVGQGIVVVETDAEGPPFVMGADASTGAERWRLEPGDSVIGLSDTVVVVAPAPLTTLPDPTAPPDGIRGVDRATGQELWASDVRLDDRSGVGVARGAAAVSDGLIAVPTGTTVTAVDMATGAVAWTAPQLDHPAAADGVFVGSEASQGPNASIRAVDASSGETLWSAPGRVSYGDLLAVGDGVSVVIEPTTAADLIAYDLATGDERWRAGRTGPGEPQLIVDQSVVVLWEADLGVRSTIDGAPVWSLTAPLHSPLMNSVGANSSTVFVAVNSLPWGD